MGLQSGPYQGGLFSGAEDYLRPLPIYAQGFCLLLASISPPERGIPIILQKPSLLGIIMARMKCSIHKIELVCYCPACRGEATSNRKAATSRANGKLGGRPKGSKNKPKPVRRKRG